MTTSLSKLRMGKREMKIGGKYLSLDMRDSNDILNNPSALRQRLVDDGFLLLRGLQNASKIEIVRQTVLKNLDTNQQIDRSFPIDQAVVAKGSRGNFLGGSKELTRSKEFLDVVESPEIVGFFDRLFGKTSLTFDYKWLRAVGPGDFTGAHYDVVYMGRGTVKNLYTVWTPLGDIPLELGTLAVLAGSHTLPSFQKLRETYGKMDVDRDKVSGHFSNDPIEMVDQFGGQWKTTEFKKGDVMIFGMHLMHASTLNETNSYRISCDTRYQPADEPVDERWIGENPISHVSPTSIIPIEVARKEWGV